MNFGSLKNLGAQLTPFAQLVNEQLGNVGEKTELPQEYLDLEKKVDALKTAHLKLLSVTSQYSREGYDYPINLRETSTDLLRTITEKANHLSTAQSVTEAQAAVTAPGPKGAPKTFMHALGRSAMSGAEVMGTSDPFGNALQKYAMSLEKVGEARLAQDSQINSQFNAAFNTTLNTNLQFAARARKTVASTRLALDSAKAFAKTARAEKADAARIDVERGEDEFVAAVEEATTVMKSCLASPEPLRNLNDLVNSQAAFHKRAAEILSMASSTIADLKISKETMFRESRDAEN